MRRYLIVGTVSALLILLFTLPGLRNASAGDREEIELLMSTFFNSLGSGNTNGILSCLAEPMLSQRKELLQQNPNYPGLLRKVYQNARIDLGELEVIDDSTMRIAVGITKANNTVRNTTFLCRKDHGLWKISEELHGKF